jgi:parallel beta-helix repeat protein
MPQQSGYHDVQKRIREYMSIGAGAPITFQGNGSISLVSGGGSGLDIAGQHDLVIAGMTFSSGNGVTISNSSAITLRTNRVVSNPRAGIDLDAATHDVQVRSNLVNSNGYASGYGFDGIRVAGTSNVVVDNILQANGAVVGNDNVAGIDVVSGAVNTVVADNRLLLNRRDGILVAGRGTDVVNNTVDASCRDGIDVADGASATVVENNISYANGGNGGASANAATSWAPIVSYTFDFGDGSAKVTQSTNTASHVYTQPGLYTVRYTKTDAAGGVATNTNTVSLAPPTAALTVTLPPMTSDQLTVTADASGSTLGSAGGTTFRYTFGDGTTLDNAASIVTHTYAHSGSYTVTVTVTDGSGLAASASRTVVLVGAYTPLGPVRVLDTRAAIGVPGTTPLQPGYTLAI